MVKGWIKYRSDAVELRRPRREILKFMDYRLTVADHMLTYEQPVDDSEIDEETTGATGPPPKRRYRGKHPSQNARASKAHHLPEMTSSKNAMRCRNVGCAS